MAKRIALKDHLSVDAVELSNFARLIGSSANIERIDVSGFADTGSTANEYLAGATEQSVEVEFYGSYGAAEVHQTLYSIHANREVSRSSGGPTGPPPCPQRTRASRAMSSCSHIRRRPPAAKPKHGRPPSPPLTRPGSPTAPPRRDAAAGSTLRVEGLPGFERGRSTVARKKP